MTQLYVTRSKIVLAYVPRTLSTSPISWPTRNHESRTSTCRLRACRKTPTINHGIHSYARRIYSLGAPIGDIAVPLRRKVLCGVVDTVRVSICTVRTEFWYIRPEWVQIYPTSEILLGTDCTWKIVELWNVVSPSIFIQFQRMSTLSASTRRAPFIS